MSEAFSILHNFCRGLDIICEQQHVELVARIEDSRRIEPLAKRLRGDVSLDPLEEPLVRERFSERQFTFRDLYSKCSFVGSAEHEAYT